MPESDQSTEARPAARLSLCGAPGCRRDARALGQALRQEAARQGVDLTLEPAPTLCRGDCPGGPYVGLLGTDFAYAGLTPDDAALVVAETLLGGRLLFSNLLISPYTVTDPRLVWDRHAGVLVLLEPGMCLVQAAEYLLEFHASQSCGKCTPCRMGTVNLRRMVGALERGGADEGCLAALEELAWLMDQASHCYFGPKEAAPVGLLARENRAELEIHLGGGCPHAGAPRLGPPGGEG